jgi:hypothetical protein
MHFVMALYLLSGTLLLLVIRPASIEGVPRLRPHIEGRRKDERKCRSRAIQGCLRA